MRKVLCAWQLIALSAFLGCSHIPFIGKSTPSLETPEQLSTIEEQTSKPADFVKIGRVVDAQALQKGRNIAIIPFKAGVGVEASDQLDRVALMIVKGISDAFADDSDGQYGRFNVLTAENSASADLIVQGHIANIKNPSKVKRWVLLKGQKSLHVSGKMVDARTGAPVLIFEDSQKTQTATEDHDKLGYRIGKNIGSFIRSDGK